MDEKYYKRMHTGWRPGPPDGLQQWMSMQPKKPGQLTKVLGPDLYWWTSQSASQSERWRKVRWSKLVKGAGWQRGADRRDAAVVEHAPRRVRAGCQGSGPAPTRHLGCHQLMKMKEWYDARFNRETENTQKVNIWWMLMGTNYSINWMLVRNAWLAEVKFF
jgi:hypothetical protein